MVNVEVRGGFVFVADAILSSGCAELCSRAVFTLLFVRFDASHVWAGFGLGVGG